jgi:hypothetical protein
MEPYVHLPDAADRDVAAHLDAGWARASLGDPGVCG